MSPRQFGELTDNFQEYLLALKKMQLDPQRLLCLLNLFLSIFELSSYFGEEGLNLLRSQELIQGEPPTSGLIFCVPHLLCHSDCFYFTTRFLT